MRSGDIFPRVADLDRVYGRVSIRRLYALALPPLGRTGEPPADPSPLPVMSGPRLPLAGPGRAAAIEPEPFASIP